jgi:hypothetical protein
MMNVLKNMARQISGKMTQLIQENGFKHMIAYCALDRR